MSHLINLLRTYDFVKSICSLIIRKGGGGGLFWLFFYRGIPAVNPLVLTNVVFSECNHVVHEVFKKIHKLSWYGIIWYKFVVAHQLKRTKFVCKVDWENIPWVYDLASKDYNLWGSNSIRANSCPLRDDIIACEATI